MGTQVTRWQRLVAALVILATVAACAEQSGDLYSAAVPESTTLGNEVAADAPADAIAADAGAGEEGAAAIGPRPTIKPPILLPQRKIHVEWGRRAQQCHGDGICIIVIDTGPSCPRESLRARTDRTVDAVASFAADTITIDLTSVRPEGGDTITVDEDIPLDECESRSLGFESLTILAGEYPIDYRAHRLGRITVNVHSGRAMPTVPPVN